MRSGWEGAGSAALGLTAISLYTCRRVPRTQAGYARSTAAALCCPSSMDCMVVALLHARPYSARPAHAGRAPVQQPFNKDSCTVALNSRRQPHAATLRHAVCAQVLGPCSGSHRYEQHQRHRSLSCLARCAPPHHSIQAGCALTLPVPPPAEPTLRPLRRRVAAARACCLGVRIQRAGVPAAPGRGVTALLPAGAPAATLAGHMPRAEIYASKHRHMPSQPHPPQPRRKALRAVPRLARVDALQVRLPGLPRVPRCLLLQN